MYQRQITHEWIARTMTEKNKGTDQRTTQTNNERTQKHRQRLVRRLTLGPGTTEVY